MRSIWVRSFDLYRLKSHYRYVLAAFLLTGFLAGVWLVGIWAYDAQLARGLRPGAPLGSEPGSVSFLGVTLVFLLGAALTGMAIGGLVLCLVLAALKQLSFRESVRAVFLSHYPRHWFRVDEQRE